MTGIIVCSGSITDYSNVRKYFIKADLIICVDGGALHLRKLGIAPHILVGDLDSIAENDYTSLMDKGVAVVKFPAEKDATDTQLAVELAMEKGCQEVILLGATGTRLDHTMANVFLLRILLEAGKKGIIADEHNEIEMINKSIQLRREKDLKISLVPVGGKVTGVTTQGLHYPLEDATLEFGTTWGISNEFANETASVVIKDGLLLVIKSRD